MKFCTLFLLLFHQYHCCFTYYIKIPYLKVMRLTNIAEWKRDTATQQHRTIRPTMNLYIYMYIKIETNCIYNLMINGKYLFIMWYFEFILFFLIPFRLLNYKCNARHAFHAHTNSTIGMYTLESLFSSFDCLGLFRFGFIWWVVVLIVVSFFLFIFFRLC